MIKFIVCGLIKNLYCRTFGCFFFILTYVSTNIGSNKLLFNSYVSMFSYIRNKVNNFNRSPVNWCKFGYVFAETITFMYGSPTKSLPAPKLSSNIPPIICSAKSEKAFKEASSTVLSKFIQTKLGYPLPSSSLFSILRLSLDDSRSTPLLIRRYNPFN
jgi:hypothetical protein